MSESEQKSVFATSETRDWWRKCDGVVLVFPDGSHVHLHFCFATSEKSGELFDPDPKKGTWSFDRAKVVLMPDGSMLVGPPGCREGESLLLSVELADQGHVIYRFSDQFNSGLKFALLPRRVFQAVEGRQRGSSSGETLLRSGGLALFVACCLIQQWLEKKNPLVERRERVDDATWQMRGILNRIGDAFNQLGTADGQLFAMETLLSVGGEFHGSD